MIETLDDIIEDLANKLGIYGACREHTEAGIYDPRYENRCHCRCCFTSSLRDRIDAAVIVDQKLGGTK